MIGLGAEAEARVAVLASAWLFARAAALGVLNGERYDVAGAPLFDTSRLQLSAGGGGRRAAVIFLLTDAAGRPTIDGVGAMPDPSRPPAPEVAALVDRARRRDPAAFRELFQTPRRRRAPGRPPDGGPAPRRRRSGADGVRRGVPVAARLPRRRAVLDLADAHRGARDHARRPPPARRAPSSLDDVAEPASTTPGPERGHGRARGAGAPRGAARRAAPEAARGVRAPRARGLLDGRGGGDPERLDGGREGARPRRPPPHRAPARSESRRWPSADRRGRAS